MIKIYVSHSIRGQYGNQATKQQMKENCDRAIAFGNWLRTKFVNVKFYVPGEMDEFLYERGVNPLDAVDGLLELDCNIVAHSDGLIVFALDDYISAGMNKEINHADHIGVPKTYIWSTNPDEKEWMEIVTWLINDIYKLKGVK